jgi:phosphoribosyl-ATP pyrophosphohydrolase
MSKDVFDKLAATIKARRQASAEDSYTRRLLDEPIKPAKKVGEEGVEVAIAAVAQDKAALVSETADLLYHLLVLLESRDVTLDEIRNELERRMGEADEKRQKAASA